MCPTNLNLTAKQQNMVNQVIATMALENMELSKEDIAILEEIASGKKKAEQAVREFEEADGDE